TFPSISPPQSENAVKSTRLAHSLLLSMATSRAGLLLLTFCRTCAHFGCIERTARVRQRFVALIWCARRLKK
ncbi:hypothetical protein, partial [Serratia marcescens]